MSTEETKFADVKTAKLVCIEYPGFIQNVDKMLQTVGGEKKVSDTYYKGKCRLQMTYRPEDYTAHFVCADLVPCTGLLMKIRRRKVKHRLTNSSEAQRKNSEIASVEYEYKQEILGIIKEQYKFQTLMDYQYLLPEPMWDYFKQLRGSELGAQDFPPYFPPPIFGRIDTCGSYDYRPDPVQGRNSHISKDLSERFQSNTEESAGCSRKRRQAESMAALFENKDVPQGPSGGAITILEKLQLNSDSSAINVIKKLFEERPIWSKLAISCHISVSLEKLKKIIQHFGYYWLSGPWRTMWCRMGYDPRKDPKAKIYQMIDFRIRDSKESKRNYKMLVPKRSYKNYIPRNLQSRVLPHGSSVLAASEQPADDVTEDTNIYIFSGDKMLPSRNMMYQLCDLHDEEVQAIIHENDGMETSCDEKEGWFPPGTMARIRAQMTKTVDAYFDKMKQSQKENKPMESMDESDLPIGENYGDETADNAEFQPISESNDDDTADFQPIRYLQMLQGNQNVVDDADFNYDDYSNYYNVDESYIDYDD